MSAVEQREASLAFVDARLRTAVEAVTGGEDDPLRGLYISDRQALDLAGELWSLDAEPRLADAARRLVLGRLEANALAACAAPELHPRYGRLYGYLQDDDTR